MEYLPNHYYNSINECNHCDENGIIYSMKRCHNFCDYNNCSNPHCMNGYIIIHEVCNHYKFKNYFEQWMIENDYFPQNICS